jgi:hypothetical protein
VSIGDLLRERTDAIVHRWVEEVLSSYPRDAAVLFQQQQDPFANPVGRSVRDGTRGIFQAILNGMDSDELRSHLDEIVRVRAVQQFSPSEALSFVFALRSIIRDVIPELDADPRLRREVAELDEKIDRVALAAFDVFAERREAVNQLRIQEVKRQVAWVFRKINQRDGGIEPTPGGPEGELPLSETVKREDLR